MPFQIALKAPTTRVYLLPTLRRWHRNHKTRMSLRLIDDARLSDLGLSRDQVDREVAKWFWQK